MNFGMVRLLLLGSCKDRVQFELKQVPLGQRLCADVTAVQKSQLPSLPGSFMICMHQDILFNSFGKQTKWREEMNLLDTHPEQNKRQVHA